MAGEAPTNSTQFSNDSENSFDASATSNHDELQSFEKFGTASAASGGKTTQGETYSQPGLQLWVDLKIDSNVQSGSDDMALETQASSHKPDLGSQTLPFVNNVGSQRASDLLMAVSVGAEANRAKITELAFKAMEELQKLALTGEPLWKVDRASNREVLSDIEYMREFGDMNATLMEIVKMVEVREPQSLPSCLDINNSEFTIGSDHQNRPKAIGPNLVTSEASREVEFVRMNASRIVETLMDLRQWSQAFSSIVSRATIIGLLSSSGVQGNFDGTLQVMKAEFHARTPLVPTRESYFARYCKNLGSGVWGVVDVSLEKLFQFSARNFQRQPSGCLIKEMEMGWSKVLWVEHVEVDKTLLVRNIFELLVSSGFAFCAKRWITALVRHCQWLETVTARRTSFATDGVLISPEGRRSLLKLSERMVKNFFIDNTSASTENKWMPLQWFWPISGAENVTFAMKSSFDDPGKPPGTTIVFSTSIYLPFPRKKVFDFLRDVKCRNKWDILEIHENFHEYAYFADGDTPGNRVSILKSMNEKKKEVRICYLQESYSDPTGSYVVYTPIDVCAITSLINGGNPDNVAILSSGFSILPYKPMHGDESGASLLTIAFHIVLDGVSMEKSGISDQHVSLVHRVLATTVLAVEDSLESSIQNANN